MDRVILEEDSPDVIIGEEFEINERATEALAVERRLTQGVFVESLTSPANVTEPAAEITLLPYEIVEKYLASPVSACNPYTVRYANGTVSTEYHSYGQWEPIQGHKYGNNVFWGHPEAMAALERLLESFNIVSVWERMDIFVLKKNTEGMGRDYHMGHYNGENHIIIVYTDCVCLISPGGGHFIYPFRHDMTQAYNDLNKIKTSICSKQIREKKVDIRTEMTRLADAQQECSLSSDVLIALSLIPQEAVVPAVDRAREKFEESQVEHEMNRTNITRTILEKEEQIKALKPPRRKRGEAAALLQSVNGPGLAFLEYVKVNIRNKNITLAFRNNLRVFRNNNRTLEYIDFGRPVVMIWLTNGSRGRDGTMISKVTALSQDKTVFTHPHLDSTRSWCLGSYIEPLGNALKAGDLTVVGTLLLDYLTKHNQNSELIRWDNCKLLMESNINKVRIERR